MMKRSGLLLLTVVVVFFMGSRAFAATDYRAMLLRTRATPTYGAKLSPDVYTPIPCSPDDLVAMLLGQRDDLPLSQVYSLSSLYPNSEEIVHKQPGGEMGFLRSAASVYRQSYSDVIIGGTAHDVEVVNFGVRHYERFAFVLLRQADGPWLLMNVIYQFEDIRLERNSENAWLVGQGEHYHSQETEAFEQWYNLKTSLVDVSYITLGGMMADTQGNHRFDANTRGHGVYSSYTYTNETGQNIVDCGLIVYAYQCIELAKNFYLGEAITYHQLDALTEVDVYIYNQHTYALEHQGTWQYNTANPAFIERGDYWAFLEGRIDLQ